MLHQDYGGPGSFKIAVFKGESPYTNTQTDDALNEQQNIIADYDVFDETQVRSQPAHEFLFLTFTRWRAFTKCLLLFRYYSPLNFPWKCPCCRNTYFQNPRISTIQMSPSLCMPTKKTMFFGVHGCWKKLEITNCFTLFVTTMQVVTLKNLSNSVAVNEVQEVTVSSNCASHLCGNTFFSLGYGEAMTSNVFFLFFFINLFYYLQRKSNWEALHLLSGIEYIFSLSVSGK